MEVGDQNFKGILSKFDASLPTREPCSDGWLCCVLLSCLFYWFFYVYICQQHTLLKDGIYMENPKGLADGSVCRAVGAFGP